MPSVKISVIVPSYNYEDYIAICINSVLNQRYKNVELIIVDDCSSDRSRNIIRGYSDQLVRVFHEQNAGHGGAFNSGFLVASGDIIVYLDADDFLNEGALEILAGSYQDDIAMYQYFLDLVDKDGTKFDIYPKREIGLAEGDVTSALCDVGGFLTTVTSGMAFSRLALLNVLPMDANVYRQGGDGYLSVTAPFYGKVKVINKCLASYRQHGDNHSQFEQGVLKRAKWCVTHTQDKFSSLKFHANKQGLPVAEPLGHKNLKYLEQLMVLSLLGNDDDKSNIIKKCEIVTYALLAISRTGVNNKHSKIIKLWWKSIGLLPDYFSILLIQWKLEASSRPKFIRSLARALRG